MFTGEVVSSPRSWPPVPPACMMDRDTSADFPAGTQSFDWGVPRLWVTPSRRVSQSAVQRV